MASQSPPSTSPGDLKALFGGAVRHLRKARKVTQEKLEELSGVKRGQISLYENGKVWPRAESLAPLLNALEVSTPDFLRLLLADVQEPARARGEVVAIAEVREPAAIGTQASQEGGSRGGNLVIDIAGFRLEIPPDRWAVGSGPPRRDPSGR